MAHKNVLVSDTGKHEILYFDLDLNFKKSFKSIKSYLSIAANDSLIFAMPMRVTRESPLVDVLDESGKLLNSFGKAIAGMEVHWVTASFGYIDISGNNEIAVSFIDYPTILRFDMKGKFINRVDCDNEDKYFRYIRKTNEKFFSDIDNRVSIPAIMNFHFGKNSYFVLKGSPYVGIIEYNYSGKRISEYWFDRAVDYAANDFIVRENKDFIFLVKSPEAAIELYRKK